MKQKPDHDIMVALRIILAGVLLLLVAPSYTGTVNVSVPLAEPIGKNLYWLKEQKSLDLPTVLRNYRTGSFIPSSRFFLNFGIDSGPIWLALDVENAAAEPLLRRLTLRTSWLDRVDVYFMHQDQLTAEFHTGDALPFRQRPVQDRYFKFDHHYSPGRTLALIRIETQDPMLLPLFLSTVDEDDHYKLLESYSYGLLYGGLSLLAFYNFLLFLSLRSRRYLYYSAYLAAFLLMNITYTGHGYRWFWPDSPRWELWSPPLMMIIFSITGLFFALRFLNIRSHFPQLHKSVVWVCGGIVTLMAGAMISGNSVLALLTAFTFVLLFSVVMILLGLLALYAGETSARYFLFASVSHTVTGSITALAVWGVLPYTTLTYHAVEIGMTIDAVLLAMALADQFRIMQNQKLHALQLAMADPLTGINNRRAFYWQVRPIWSNNLRKGHPMSLVMLDIDHFKRINDRYGHACGDSVLKKLAKMLDSEGRSADVVARWGGEEFILFLGETSLKEGLIFAERMCGEIAAAHLQFGDELLTFTASFGVASVDGNITDLEGLIVAADKGVYFAKRKGRNRVCHIQEIPQERVI